MIRRVVSTFLQTRWPSINPHLNSSLRTNLSAFSTSAKHKSGEQESEPGRKRHSKHWLLIMSSLLLSFFFRPQTNCEQAPPPPPSPLTVRELNKQELTSLLHPHKNEEEYLLLIYDKYLRDKEDFDKELQRLSDICQQLSIAKIYIVTSKDVQHLQHIATLLQKDRSPSESEKEKKSFRYFYNSTSFDEQFQLLAQDRSILEQIREIQSFRLTQSLEEVNESIQSLMSTELHRNKSILVKQCPGSGECVDSYKREVKRLIDSGVMAGKAEEYEFHLFLTQAAGSKPAVSENVKSFYRLVEKDSPPHAPNFKKEEIFLFRNDLIGRQVVSQSDWLQGEGARFSAPEQWLMFIRPRVQVLSKANFDNELYWYIAALRGNGQPTISINNTEEYLKGVEDKMQLAATPQVIRLLHAEYPLLNLVVVNTSKVSELIRHLHSNHKYVIYKQGEEAVYPKRFLRLEELEAVPPLDQPQLKERFARLAKPDIDEFLKDVRHYDWVGVEKEMEINLEKLRELSAREKLPPPKKGSKAYVVRVCRRKCRRDLSEEVVERVRGGKEAVRYWIDSEVHNVGAREGVYLLEDGELKEVEQSLR